MSVESIPNSTKSNAKIGGQRFLSRNRRFTTGIANFLSEIDFPKSLFWKKETQVVAALAGTSCNLAEFSARTSAKITNVPT